MAEGVEVVQPGDEEAQVDLITLYDYGKEDCGKVESSLFSQRTNYRTTGNGHKWCQERFTLEQVHQGNGGSTVLGGI